ncbi:MAG: glycosyltransferase family 87 protein [Acidimicrobiales bacterium]
MAVALGDDGGAPSDRRRPRALIAAIVVPPLILVVAGWLRRWSTDDAFINYRIVDQIRAGNGPVYNAGERVEAFTSPLWLALLTLGDTVLPMPLEYVSVILSILMSALGVVAMGAGSRRLLDPAVEGDAPGSIWWVPAGSLVLLALPPVWDFATAGLETGLTLAWVGVLTLGLARVATNPGSTPTWFLLAIGLGPLVRPDCLIPAVFVLAFVGAVSWRASGAGRTIGRLAVAVALPVAYQVFRMAYFAALVPNTALAKAASSSHWGEGWHYLLDFGTPYVLYLPLGVGAIAAAVLVARLPGRHRAAAVTLPAAAVFHAAFILRAGGDYIHARLLLPPLFSLVAPFALLPVPSLRRAWRSDPQVGRSLWTAGGVLIAVTLLMVWAGVTATFLRKTGPTIDHRTIVADGRSAAIGSGPNRHPVTAEDFGWGQGSAAAKRLQGSAVSLGDRRLPVRPAAGLPVPTAARHGIGVPGYSVGVKVNLLDLLGLADPLTARLRVDQGGFIGHEKPLPNPWLAARLSDHPIDPRSFPDPSFATPLYSSPPGRFEADVRDARQAARCPPLVRLRQATRGRLTLHRALSNIWRAPELTGLRIDPDPHRALAQLC